MSLYYEAAKVLEDVAESSKPLKQRVYNDKSLKSSPGAIFALVSEAAKWSEILSDVIDNSGILGIERKLTPTLSIVLAHDLLLAKKGLSASKKHPLYDLISKHKARLNAEFTRARIKRGAQSIDSLRNQINTSSTETNGDSNGATNCFYPRWVRINTIKTSFQDCLASTFRSYTPVPTLQALRDQTFPSLFIDPNIPNLIAIHPSSDLTKSPAYHAGHIILQDKASCFPAYLLSPTASGRVIDGCAAPGNKTTHLAAILSSASSTTSSSPRVIACERAPDRAITLKSMVARAGASDLVEVRAGQDFLSLPATGTKYADVKAILLDPSCSGSGIVGRDDAPAPLRITLPAAGGKAVAKEAGGKKRKRSTAPVVPKADTVEEEQEEEKVVQDDGEKLAARLRQLAAFQLRIVTHAMAFEGVERITYSTCSVHGVENEGVVIRALASDVARRRGWRVLRREEQIDGMKKWERRGDEADCRVALESVGDVGLGMEVLADACIRATKGTEEGTMGFFVAGFVRDGEDEGEKHDPSLPVDERYSQDDDEGDDWSGFSD
ncbi:S-adenosyl-L-methionine-dependent methyltransferase [Myriangium duriaei CBS 260.36]|uniref:S-adenosyl-L-methionine-dependent methyltransferase n=1 Tax=Myriangium duriaei CBS 260.36 TaxID=1168546 RepID=A0A9P4IRI0_9PEZI|nr:S-adenosyl-L-methionine-dependent methyltransferase [Myriangium duriaei CBS 260.36]